ncbi:Short-chain dehydrogenase [Streptomyces sp. LamerLS-316]|uniref:SDR family NAD(P)-dependent oxidoreductase n=1 Tax=unclassified Streptomyces TaxID=2593676 RepID=UPI000823F52D|nr:MULTISPECIES: SDR family NAD(P)-dependent oxidoreductase [unclassified Streptomyces]MYQ36828.1 SDR family NAD(P)-dependent oxidoreductase [Streptomyces sp. SID4921]SCK51342.1 Short-chain dehydrogenase [Streptomyces sp. LamerLS-316]
MTEHAPKAVVTAGTGGIGLETALGLARRGWDVTLVARDPARGEAAVARVDEAAGRPAGRFVRADLSSLAATRRLGERLAAEGALNLLVNNVGGMWTERWESPEGIEASIALNHLSPYVLTGTLLDALAAAAPSRVVNVTSSAITAAEAVFDEAEPPGPHYGLPATGRAKLAHLAHSMELAGRLAPRGISVIAADPGAAATGNAALMTIDILPPAMRPFWEQIQKGVSAPVAAAATGPLAAALDPALEGRTGLVVGPDGTVDDTLLAFVTPEVTEAVRRWTAELMSTAARAT